MLEIVVDVREQSLIEKLRGLAEGSGSSIAIITEQLLLGDILLRTTTRAAPNNVATQDLGAAPNNVATQDLGAAPNNVATSKEFILYERKSFADLLASIKDGRYEEQSHRLIHSGGFNPHNICYVLEGTFATLRNPADKRIILSAMTSLSFFKGFSVFRTATIFETAELIWSMANKIQKEFEKGREVPSYCYGHSLSSQHSSEENKKEDNVAQVLAQESYSNFVKKAKRDNITPENIGEILLCQIPGISSHIATEVLKHFGGSFRQLIEEINTSPEKLDAIYLESSKGDGKRRKLSSAVVQSILRFLK